MVLLIPTIPDFSDILYKGERRAWLVCSASATNELLPTSLISYHLSDTIKSGSIHPLPVLSAPPLQEILSP
jgi:hypothetical protein